MVAKESVNNEFTCFSRDYLIDEGKRQSTHSSTLRLRAGSVWCELNDTDTPGTKNIFSFVLRASTLNTYQFKLFKNDDEQDRAVVLHIKI